MWLQERTAASNREQHVSFEISNKVAWPSNFIGTTGKGSIGQGQPVSLFLEIAHGMGQFQTNKTTVLSRNLPSKDRRGVLHKGSQIMHVKVSMNLHSPSHSPSPIVRRQYDCSTRYAGPAPSKFFRFPNFTSRNYCHYSLFLRLHYRYSRILKFIMNQYYSSQIL
jgi:hypothetical protein